MTAERYATLLRVYPGNSHLWQVYKNLKTSALTFYFCPKGQHAPNPPAGKQWELVRTMSHNPEWGWFRTKHELSKGL
jgi:hypothetical protein